MTREEAISILKKGTRFETTLENKDYPEAFEMAIKALEQGFCEDCISRADAKEIIAQTDITDGYESVFSGRQVIALLDDLPSVQPKTGWIPVSERLPNKYGNYLVTKKRIRNYGFEDIVEIGQYTIGCQWNRCDSRVTAWMPLPEPYKESED